MTLIIGYGNGKESAIAGDRCALDPHKGVRQNITFPKVFSLPYEWKHDQKKEKILIGYTSSFRMGQVIQHHVNLPDRVWDCSDALVYIVKYFIPEIKKAFERHWTAIPRDNLTQGGEFIVIMDHRVFKIEEEFLVIEFDNNYCMAGCGDEIAYGSLMAFQESGTEVEESIKKTFEIVNRYSYGVSKEYDLIKG